MPRRPGRRACCRTQLAATKRSAALRSPLRSPRRSARKSAPPASSLHPASVPAKLPGAVQPKRRPSVIRSFTVEETHNHECGLFRSGPGLYQRLEISAPCPSFPGMRDAHFDRAHQTRMEGKSNPAKPSISPAVNFHRQAWAAPRLAQRGLPNGDMASSPCWHCCKMRLASRAAQRIGDCRCARYT